MVPAGCPTILRSPEGGSKILASSAFPRMEKRGRPRLHHRPPPSSPHPFHRTKTNPKETRGNSSTDYTADLPRTAKVAKEPPLGAAGTHVLRRGSRGYDGSARGLRSRKRSSSGSLPRFFQQRRLDRTPLHGVRKLGIFRRRSRRSHFCVGLASVVAEG